MLRQMKSYYVFCTSFILASTELCLLLSYMDVWLVAPFSIHNLLMW